MQCEVRTIGLTLIDGGGEGGMIFDDRMTDQGEEGEHLSTGRSNNVHTCSLKERGTKPRTQRSTMFLFNLVGQ